MKIRQKFVSNSSSSSFCVAKCYLTEAQINALSDYCLNDEGEFDDFLEENDYYFQGEIANHNHQLDKVIEDAGIDKKYLGWAS